MEENKISKEQISKGMILIGAFIMLRAGMVQLFGNPSGHIDLNYFIFLSISFLIGSVGIVYFGFTKWVGTDLKKWWFHKKSIKGDIGWGILGLIIVMILSSILALSFLSSGLVPKETIPVQPDISLSLVLSGLFFGFAIASFQEETLFRGFFQNVVSERFGKWKGNIIQAAFFSIAHVGYYPLESWPLFIIAFVSGLVFGWLRMKRGNLLAPFIAHGFMG